MVSDPKTIPAAAVAATVRETAFAVSAGAEGAADRMAFVANAADSTTTHSRGSALASIVDTPHPRSGNRPSNPPSW